MGQFENQECKEYTMNHAKQRRNTATNYRCSFHKSATADMPDVQKQSLDSGGWLCGFANVSPSNRNAFGGGSVPLDPFNLFKMWQYPINQFACIRIQAGGASRLEDERKCQTTAIILRLRQIFQLEAPLLSKLLNTGEIFICTK